MFNNFDKEEVVTYIADNFLLQKTEQQKFNAMALKAPMLLDFYI